MVGWDGSGKELQVKVCLRAHKDRASIDGGNG